VDWPEYRLIPQGILRGAHTLPHEAAGESTKHKAYASKNGFAQARRCVPSKDPFKKQAMARESIRASSAVLDEPSNAEW